MARKTITEHKAKSLLSQSLGNSYTGILTTSDISPKIFQNTVVIKVDEGVKRRFKQGLVLLDQQENQISQGIKNLQQKGYKRVLIEEYVPHDPKDEKYLAIERVRDGYKILYANVGGINIEDASKSVQTKILKQDPESSPGLKVQDDKDVVKTLGLPQDFLPKLLEAFDAHYVSFLEINPLLVQNGNVTFLDVAAEVDDTAAFFVSNSWTSDDFTFGTSREQTPEEKAVIELSAKSQAALKLDVLNKDGRIFMLLSGGGASIVVADEVHDLGFGKELADYGEYSGNPNAEETYIYTKNLLSLLLKSKAKKKVLFIAGGVANFTDVRITFRGIIKAFDEVKDQLRKQGVKVFVRRGGPHQEEGLAMIESFLKKENLFGAVHGPDLMLTQIVEEGINYVRH